MNANNVKFEFEIQFLHTCHESNGDSVYTVSIFKIYSYCFRVDESICTLIMD